MSTPTIPYYPATHDDAVALIAAIAALMPGLVTTTQRGMLAPDAEAIENGFIKVATPSNKGLLSKTFATLLTDPDKIIFYANSVTGTAGFHNSFFREKYLGDHVTDAQWAAISAGTFDDMFVGDYWIINGITWRIAAFDYWLRCGDTECTTHHVVVVPDSNLLTADGSTTHWMNATNVTTGAYVGSDFYTGNNSNTGKSQCISKVNSAFGSAHILSHREYFQNAVTNGYASAGSWYDSTVDMMNEQMVYGCRVFGDTSAGANIPTAYTIDKSQLPLFRLAPSFICNRAYWWLRDVASATDFARVSHDGLCGSVNAADTWAGVRPAFGIRA